LTFILRADVVQFASVDRICTKWQPDRGSGCCRSRLWAHPLCQFGSPSGGRIEPSTGGTLWRKVVFLTAD